VVKTAAVRHAERKEAERLEAWSELDRRRFSRLLLEEVLPGALRRLPQPASPEIILTYRSAGEFIGEMGVYQRQPRRATCVAYGQPRSPKEEDLGRVELVRIPAEVFLDLMERFPVIRESVQREITRREQETEQRLRADRAGTDQGGPLSREAARLGLNQGQKLMLIDMERCTPVRRVRAGMRRCPPGGQAQPIVPHRPSIRPLHGADHLPVVPRSGVHDWLPGPVDSTRRQSPDPDRGLVHRLPAVCQELSLRRDQNA
jgi:hypothetical protein